MSSDGGAPARAHPVATAGGATALGVGVGVALAVAGLPLIVAVAVGAGFIISLLLVASGARRSGSRPPRMDPFTLSEPWRQFVISVHRADQQLARTVMSVDEGPLQNRLASIAARLEDGVTETWQIAQRGDQIDEAIARLDPARLRSRRDTVAARGDSEPAELEALDRQIDAVDRLQAQSARTVDTLRLMAARFDELAARATEVAVGAADTDAYSTEVDDLLIELESLRLAIEETRGQ